MNTLSLDDKPRHILAHENGTLIVVTLVSESPFKTVVQEDQGTTRFSVRPEADYRKLFKGPNAVDEATDWQRARRSAANLIKQEA